MRVDSLPFHERVQIGNAKAALIAECLNKHHGFKLVQASLEEDMNDKIDYYECSKKKKLKVQVKERDKNSFGDDLLYDLYEPWHGDLEDSLIGRDHVAKFDLYLCLDRGDEWIRAVSGKAMKNVIKTCESEWIEQGCNFPLSTKHGKRFWNSKIHDKVQFWLHRDKKNRRLKVLAFVPESCFNEKQIKKYKFI